MPEGNVIHFQARRFAREAGGRVLRVSSPQGRFAEGAALLDGMRLAATEAHGKHLFLAFAEPDAVAAGELPAAREAGAAATGAVTLPDGVRWLHVHLGLYGKWWWQREPRGAAGADTAEGADTAAQSTETQPAEPTGSAGNAWNPEPARPTSRVHFEAADGPGWIAELTGPTRCAVITTAEKQAVEDRLGPDPLRPDHQATGAKTLSDTIRASRRAVGELLMDQSIAAGVGNIYRAEALFRARLNPYTPGVEVSARKAHAIWRDLVVLMAAGSKSGAIVTTDPEHRPHGEHIGPLAPVAEHASEWEGDQRFYVYKRTGRKCHRCTAKVAQAEMVGRQLYWCPRCQRR